MKRLGLIFIGLFLAVFFITAWLLNSQISAQFTKCIKPSRATDGVVVIGKVVNIREIGENTAFDIRLCYGDSRLLEPKVSIVAPSGFITVVKRQGNGFYYGNERTKNFINSSGQFIAMRMDPHAPTPPGNSRLQVTPTQISLINQLRKPSPFNFFLPYLFTSLELIGSTYFTANDITEIEDVITANGI